ncbi:MAG: 50S ribosomal protein L10 [Eubacteriales bacterium]
MPSEKVLAQKQAQVDDLVNKMTGAAAGVLVNYTGITVEDDTQLRKELREAGVSYKVYKNKLTERACEKIGFGAMAKYLEGMNAFAVSPTDPVIAAKIIKKYADKVPTFEIKAGFVDGAVVDANAVNALAETPNKEVLIGKMLGSMQSSLYAFVRVLQAKIDKDGGEAVAE